MIAPNKKPSAPTYSQEASPRTCMARLISEMGGPLRDQLCLVMRAASSQFSELFRGMHSCLHFERAAAWFCEFVLCPRQRHRVQKFRRCGHRPFLTRHVLELPRTLIFMAPNTWVFNTWSKLTFLGSGRPGGPKNHSRRLGASPPTFWNSFCGRRGRPEPENRRCPAGPKTMY